MAEEGHVRRNSRLKSLLRRLPEITGGIVGRLKRRE